MNKIKTIIFLIKRLILDKKDRTEEYCCSTFKGPTMSFYIDHRKAEKCCLEE